MSRGVVEGIPYFVKPDFGAQVRRIGAGHVSVGVVLLWLHGRWCQLVRIRHSVAMHG